MMINHFCNAAGCRVVLPYGENYCQRHKDAHKEYMRKYRVTVDNGRANEFYHTKEWRHLSRHMLLTRPSCEWCERTGIIRPATAVDHKIPIRVNWSKRLDSSNLQCLCASCHHKKTMADKKKWGL